MAQSTTASAQLLPLSYVHERRLPLRLLAWFARFARHKPLGFVGLLIVLTLVLMAIFAPQLAPYSPDKTDLKHHLAGSTAQHRLGTDATGRDVLSRLIYGARVSMMVGFGAVAISTLFATALGVISGFRGGWFDAIVQRFVDAWQALPGLIILITLMGIARRMRGVNIVWAMVLAIGILAIAGTSRVIRSAVIAIRGQPYVEAARALGADSPRLLLWYVLPNVLPIIFVIATVGLGGVILLEASLSFLGFGPAGQPSWGQMLSVDGRDYMRVQPGLAVYPGLCIGAAVFGFNVFGDALRDIVDPRLRGQGRR
jgi:peptide/nickel transport system permease protein